MNKDSNKIGNKKNSSSLKKDKYISEIERKVDKLLSENKYKPSKINSKSLDVERFSLKNKDGEAIYFLKEKTKKKTDDSDVDRLNREIASKARAKLGKEPIEKYDDIELTDIQTERVKVKKRIKFGKKKPTPVEDAPKKQTNEEKIPKTDDAETKETSAPEDLVDKIEKEHEKHLKFSEMTSIESDEIGKDEEEFLDEKITEGPPTPTADLDKKEDAGETKVTELAKKHHLFEKKKEQSKIKGKKKDKKDSKVDSSTQDDLEKLEMKYGDRLKLPETDSFESDEIAKDDEGFLDEKISETPLAKDVGEKKTDIIGVEKKKPKKKKSFFKRKKPSEDEQIKEKEDDVGPKTPVDKLRLRVENIPSTGDINKEEVSDEEEYDTELKAIKLAEKHLKEGVAPTVEKEVSIPDFPKKQHKEQNVGEKEVKEPSELIPGESQKDEDLEHIFFDEEDAPSVGWSPQITDKDKKDMSLTPSAQFEDVGAKAEIELPKAALQSESIKLTDLGFSESEWEELDFYVLREPFAYVEILRERESLDKRYFLVEVDLTDEEQKTLDFIRESLARLTINSMELDERGEDKYLLDRVEQILEDYDITLNDDSRKRILYYLEKTSLGIGMIDPLMSDPNIEDISCDGAKVPLFLYHRRYGSLKSNVEFKNEEELSSFIHKLAQKCGKHISIAEPMLDATMPDGSRIQMTLSDEVTAKGSTFTIRKFREDPFSPPDLVEFNTMSAEMIAYMWIAVENGVNTLVAGGTAAGKTTVLNALSLFIPREAKIVSIEETREINLPHSNWIPGIARSGFGEIVADRMVGEIDMYDLMKAALRQRPEYIIVGEIRGKEAYVLFQAMATGHATYSTVHADSAQSLIHRLEGKPINIPRVMLQSLDIISLHVITRVKNKRARRCKQIIEIIDIDPTTKEILTNEVFRWDPVEDTFIYSGKSYVLERIRVEKDLSREAMTEEIKNRTKIVEWMNSNNLREFREVSKIVSQYLESPSEVLKKVDGADK